MGDSSTGEGATSCIVMRSGAGDTMSPSRAMMMEDDEQWQVQSRSMVVSTPDPHA